MKTLNLFFIAFTLLVSTVQVNASNVTLTNGTTAYASDLPFGALTDGDTLFIHDTFYMDTDWTACENMSIILIVEGVGSTIYWTDDFDLKLGSGSSMLFKDGGDLSTSLPCNNNKSIFFGGIEVAACNGGNQGVLNFDDIVYAGGIDSTGSPVPVSWMGFTATLAGANQVLLNWTTATEINNSHFEMEYSIDGLTWNTFGTVSSAADNGNSMEILDYQYNHYLGELSNIIYYRIKQVDFNGEFDYSTVAMVTIKTNPIKIGSLGEGRIHITTTDLAHSQIRIFNTAGQLVTSGQLDNNSLNMVLPTTGIYVIEVTTRKHVDYIKQFVQ